ncbi:hypothetical protein CVT91_00320 [Candidatus Atribacteria bacterium HGW-Atribacteria-1]|nr:MAG: hypothetical protein CVT91_00320 [Candidatus Atribacteria bacterium HGW-Atribacteria-1]
MKRVVFCLLLFCGISSAAAGSPPVGAAESPPVGAAESSPGRDDYGAVVNSVSGEVKSLKKNSQDWTMVVKDDIFSSGDIIKTFADGSCEVYLIDGTIFDIGPNSLLKIDDLHGEDSFLKRAIFDLEMGELLSEIEKGLDYRVRTPQAVCAVRGTKFAVKAGKESRVAVFDGKVGVRHYEKSGKLAKRAQIVKKMQEARIGLYAKPQLGKKISEDMRAIYARMAKNQQRRKELRKKIIKKRKEILKARKKRILESGQKQQKDLIQERREKKAPVRRKN